MAKKRKNQFDKFNDRFKRASCLVDKNGQKYIDKYFKIENGEYYISTRIVPEYIYEKTNGLKKDKFWTMVGHITNSSKYKTIGMFRALIFNLIVQHVRKMENE